MISRAVERCHDGFGFQAAIAAGDLQVVRALFDSGVRVTVNTDDAIVFGVGVSEEFRRLHQAGLFTSAELDLIRVWGLEP